MRPILLAVLLLPSLAVAKPVKVGDATLSIVVGDTLDSLELTIERKGKEKTSVRGWSKLAAGKPAPFEHCEIMAASVDAQKLGKRTGARIDVACRNGEDMLHVAGATILVDTIEPYAVLWVGDGDSIENENGACITEHRVTFALDGKQLAESIVDTEVKNADGSCTPGGKPGKKKTKKSRQVIALD
jgi:hypothetical protein